MQTTPHADANRLLESLLARLQGLLREKLVGLYLYGSLATGDFDPGISDVDLLAALASGLGDAELASLRAMHGDLARDEPEWADRVEVAYVSLRALRTFRSERSSIAVISPGEPFHAKDAGSDWLANWYAVREEGRALFGPPAATLIAPISRDEFERCIRGYAADWGDRIHGVRERREQAYAILTMCRALHLHCRGERASKREAARWAQDELPQWSGLIRNALAWRRAWREESVDHAATRAETVSFVQLVRDRILARCRGARGD